MSKRLEDTPTGQNTFHGTVVVINQRADGGEPVNGPLIITKKAITCAVDLQSAVPARTCHQNQTNTFFLLSTWKTEVFFQ